MPYESAAFRLDSVDRVATLWFDFRNSRENVLTLATLNEFSLLIDRVAELPADVLVLRSSRPGVFLDDFDIRELAGFRSPMEFSAFATRGQDLTRKIAALSFPTIAFIDGRCKGVGLEIALAASTRLISDSPSTTFSFPSIDRGLIPCWGGIHRLMSIVGRRAAEQFLRSRMPLNAQAAFKIGLADRLSPASRASVDLMTLVDEVSAGRSLNHSRLRRRLMRSLAGLIHLKRNDESATCRPESVSAIGEVLEIGRAHV